MNEKNKTKQDVRDSIITLLNNVAEIVKDANEKSPKSKSVMNDFSKTSNNLLKKLCELIDADYDSIFKEYAENQENKAIKEALSKRTEPKTVVKGSGAFSDGTELFEPLRSDKEVYDEIHKDIKKANISNKDIADKNIKDNSKVKDIDIDNKLNDFCVFNIKCSKCPFNDVCFIVSDKPEIKEENKNKEIPETVKFEKNKPVDIKKKYNINTNDIKSVPDTIINVLRRKDITPSEIDVKKNKNDLSSKLRYEYEQKKLKEKESKEKLELTKKEEEKKLIPEIYTRAVFNILNDKKTHAYKFCEGTDNAAPAVEVTILDKYNVGKDLGMMTLICDKIKKDGGFPFVTASQSEKTAKDKVSKYKVLTFYLILY